MQSLQWCKEARRLPVVDAALAVFKMRLNSIVRSRSCAAKRATTTCLSTRAQQPRTKFCHLLRYISMAVRRQGGFTMLLRFVYGFIGEGVIESMLRAPPITML